MSYAHISLGQLNSNRLAGRKLAPGAWRVARPTNPAVAAPPVVAAQAAPAKNALNSAAMDHRATSLFLAFAVTACIFAAVLGAFDGAAQRGSEVSAMKAAPAPAIAAQATPEAARALAKDLRTIELPTVVIRGKRL